MSVVRHFTATAYVVHDGRVALHWHPKVKAWLPPGSHIEENEDPVQAVLRETEEETGLKTVVVPTGPAIDLSYPVLVQPPLTIMVEDIHDPVDGYHQHCWQPAKMGLFRTREELLSKSYRKLKSL